MNLLPGWPSLLAAVPATPVQAPAILPSRVDLARAAGRLHIVDTAEAAAELVQMLKSVPPSAIALDTEFGFRRPDVEIRGKKPWNDIRSQAPVCVSLAAAATGDDGSLRVLRAVLDVRCQDVVPFVEEILNFRCRFVFHNVKAELFTFWVLGLDPMLPNIYDTYAAAACLNLGRYHRRAAAPAANEADQIRGEARLAERRDHLRSLVGQCEIYGLGYPYSSTVKDDLRKAFMVIKATDEITPTMAEYAAADAEWTLRLYYAQQPDVLTAGLQHHLETIEFPFAMVNARMEWNGVHVDPDRLRQLRASAPRAAEHYASVLATHGLIRPGSGPAFLRLMEGLGLAKHFVKDGHPSLKDAVLEAAEEIHPAVRAFRLYRRYRRLASEEWLTGALTGADGRIHPRHTQLGAATGRNSCSTPNLAGIGRILRPIVTAPPGRALIEADFAQIEVGVAAAEYGDDALIAACNSGDVYGAMAQSYYAPELTAEEKALSPAEFASRRGDRRNAMKTFVLAVMYNIQAPAIATRFDISLHRAEAERQRFLDLYPALRRALEESAVFGALRGYATTVSGLRRHVDIHGAPSSWAKNTLRNTPIQGSATTVFKTALILLDQAFRGSDAKLVLPIHDAILIECSIDSVDAVSKRVETLMSHALRAVYPMLNGKVTINKSNPNCWNKDGKADSLARFLDNPEFKLD